MALTRHGPAAGLHAYDDPVIDPGEAVEFGTWTPHWFGAIAGPVEAIGIFGAQGERVHLPA